MTAARSGPASARRAVIVGAGVGGLAAACRLAGMGYAVDLVERHGGPGGKMRTQPSIAGPVDAGPTVLTLRGVIDALFADLGERTEDHVTLRRQPLIARHFWPDGSSLDLWEDENASADAIRRFSGGRSERQFRAFCAEARLLFEAIDAPMMQTRRPSPLGLARHCLSRPGLLRRMAPLTTLAARLARRFDDPRLAQLFGRYATYVGGSPYRAPSLLSLIWHAEASGVWTVDGGMHQLARALEALAQSRGARLTYDAHVDRVDLHNGSACGVTLADGRRIRADIVVFNGDPRALATGALGTGATGVARQTLAAKRSLSAEVWAFAARVSGPDLALHNVFFRDDPRPEFDALERGRYAPDPTLYVCAMDRAGPDKPTGPERFEIIANAPPLPAPDPEVTACHTRTFRTLGRFGLRFDPPPGPEALTTPAMFETLFPASLGSLYGQSPHGLMAAFRRPTARTRVPGLYLVGGGAHPGAGVPMAILSARHAAETILRDRTLTSPSRRTATPGGMPTGSATTAPAPSASSRS